MVGRHTRLPVSASIRFLSVDLLSEPESALLLQHQTTTAARRIIRLVHNLP